MNQSGMFMLLLAACGLASFDSDLSSIDSGSAGRDSDRNDSGWNDTGEADTGDGQSTGPDSARTPRPGELLVHELMINPSAVSDGQGEYTELRNLSTDWLDLAGVALADDDVDLSELQQVYAQSLLLAPGGLLVVCASSTGNGGVDCQATINPKSTGGGFVLANSEDEVIVLSASGQTLDTVRYGGSFVLTGAALGLRPSSQDAVANDSLGNWCEQTTGLSAGDSGTPGANNNGC
ncbi:MAG: hypothetical protein ACI9VR_003446 [Cognaticolwellia sp.]|jgi:hypothetical protein